MVKKSNFLKNLLTTASILAVTASAGNAMAQDIQNATGQNAIITVGGGNNITTTANPPVAAKFANTDNFRFISNNTLTTGGAVTIGTIDVNNKTAGNFTVAHNVSLASVVNNGGVQKLNTIVNDGKTLTLTGANVSALGNVTLGSGGGAGTLDFTAANTTLTGNIDSNAAAANGVININAVNVVFEGSVGAANKLAALDIKAGKSATLAKTGDNKITTVTIDNGSTLSIGNGVNITSTKIDGAVNNKGTLKFDGKSTVAADTIGNNTALEAIEIGNALVDFSTTTNLKAAKTTLSGANSAIKFSAANSNSTTDFVTTADSQGKITFGENHILKGNIGAKNAAFANIEVIDGKTLIIEKDKGQLYATNVTATGNGTAILNLKGADFEIHANIGASANKFAEINLQGNEAGKAATFKLMAGKNIHATNVDLAKTNNVDNTLELYENASITGNIVTTNGNSGTISVKGNNAKIDGAIGVVGTAINKIIFNEAAELTVGKNSINTNAGIEFKENGTLNLTEAADFTMGQAIIVAKSDANGLGTVKVNGATGGQLVKFDQIGDVAVADKSLKLLEVTGGANIELNKDASIKKLNIGSQNVEIRLTNANGEYLISELAHNENRGALVLEQDATLKKDTNLGAALDFIQLNDKTLTIQDGVDLTATNGIKSSGANNGNLVFKGSSTVSGVVGSNNKLASVTIDSNNKAGVVDFSDKFNIAGDLKIAQGDTAILGGEVYAKTIQGNAANQGTVEFNNKEVLTGATAVTAAIGGNAAAGGGGAAGNPLDTVVLSGKDITFNEATGIFKTNTLSFSGNKLTELTATFTKLGVNALQNTTITTDSEIRGHHIVLDNANHTLNAAIGDAKNHYGNFTLSDGKTLNIGNADFYAGVISKTNQQGTVNFGAAQNGNVVQLGTAEKELETVNFKGDITAHGVVYSKNINVEDNKKAIFKDIVSSSDGAMTIKAGTHIIFDGANARSEAAIVANAAGNGIVEYNNTTTISEAVGTVAAPVNAIRFTGTDATKVANVGADLSANNIVIGAQKFRPNKDIKLNGSTAINGSTIDLSSANVTLAGGQNSRMNGDVTINTKFKDGKIGHLIVDGKATKLDAATNSLTISINDTEDLPVKPKDYILFAETNGGVVNNITTAANIKSPNKFIKWTQNGDKITRSNNAVNAINEALKNNKNKELVAEAGNKYGNANNIGDAKAFTTDLAQMTDAQINEALERVTATTAIHAPKVVAAIEESANQVISNRMGALSNHPQAGKQLADSGVSGVAAGEDNTIYGAWVSSFYNNTTQKSLKGNSGFKSSSYGATIGFDTQANADLTIGLAGTYAKTDMKHKNFKSGDKTKADTFLFSIYAIQQLTNEWFLQGHTSFSTSSIKNTEKRNTSAGNEKAKGNFDTTSYTAELMAGYNHVIDNAVITPLIGTSYTRINDGGYKETGTTNQNLNVTRKATNKFEAILGLRAQMTTSMEGIDVTPEIHAFVKHDLVGQNAKVTTRHNGLVSQLSPKSAKAQKTVFNVGFGVNAVSGVYEYGAGYDLNVAEKSLGHQGTLKVRLNF